MRIKICLLGIALALSVTACDANSSSSEDGGRDATVRDSGLVDSGAADSAPIPTDGAPSDAADARAQDAMVPFDADAFIDGRLADAQTQSNDAAIDVQNSDATTDAACDGAACSAGMVRFMSTGGPAGGSSSESWGYHVDISGDGQTLVVSGVEEATHVFAATGTGWRETFSVTAAATDRDLGYVNTISADGNTFAVSSYDTGFGVSGPVFVYVRQGDTWAEQGRLAPAPQPEANYFGSALAISADGNAIVVARNNSDSRGATVFTRTGSTWDTGADFPSTDDELCGVSVAMSADGNMFAVVCDHQEERPVVKVYSRGQADWTQTATLMAPASAGQFGSSMAMSAAGDVIVVGDYDSRATAYIHSGSSWSGPTLVPSVSAGKSVDLSADGQRLVVGDESGGVDEVGTVTVFVRTGSSWSSPTVLERTTPLELGNFGRCVAMSADGHTIAVGDVNVEPSGFVSVFRDR